MAITRTQDIDDDGSYGYGTLRNNAWKQQIYDQIDAALALLLPLAGGTLTGGLVVNYNGASVQGLILNDTNAGSASAIWIKSNGASIGSLVTTASLFTLNFPKLNLTGGLVGINKAAPLTQLDVQGTSSAPGGTGASSGGIVTVYVSDTTASLVIGALTVAPYSPWIQTHDPGAGIYPLALNPLGGNVTIGGTAVRATTPSTKALQIFDGTAPVGTLANGVSLYSVAGKLWAMDAAGTATKLTP